MPDSNIVRDGQHNIGHICSRQQCDLGHGGRLAFRWIASNLQRTEYSFADLEQHSSRLANALRSAGFCKGDVLFVHLPKGPELYFSVLGALKLGLIVSTTFSRLSETAVVERLNKTGARGILTKRRLARQFARLRSAVPSLAHVLATDIHQHETDGILSAEVLVGEASADFLAERTDASVPSFIHFTPAPLAQARAVVHVHGAVQHIAATTRQVLQLAQDDLFWCTADHGWVTGTAYGIVAPWSMGVGQMQFGGGYTPEGWLGLLEREGVSVWYTAPSVIRMMMREDPALFTKFELKRLKHIFSVGEWLDPDALAWSRRVLGRDVYDTYFQTETGGIVIANRPGLPIRPGSMGQPVDGIEACVLDDAGNGVPADAAGHLTLRAGWPSMFVDYLGDSVGYRGKFRGAHYYTGDAARQDGEGYFWFGGRNDDIINTAGHLVSPAEVEFALLECPEVDACVVVRVPDPVLLEKVAAFILLKPFHVPSVDLELEIRLRVTRRLSPVESPQEVRFVEVMPTDSAGRIDREALRAQFPELWASRAFPWETW